MQMQRSAVDMTTTTPSVDELKLRFSQMSMYRDKDIPSTTEARMTPTDRGYVHEIVSTSAPSDRPGSAERVASVTKRRVITTGGEGTAAAPIRLASTTEVVAPLVAAAIQRPLPKGSSTEPSATSGFLSTASRASVSSPPPPTGGSGTSTEWQRRSEPVFSPLPTQPSSLAQGDVTRRTLRSTSSSAARSVEFGATGTTFVEPSRLSPMRVETVYAPVRYLTRRQLRSEMESKRRQCDLSSRIRSSSVPRVDAMLRDATTRSSSVGSNSSQRSNGGFRRTDATEDSYRRLRDEQLQQYRNNQAPAPVTFAQPMPRPMRQQDNDDAGSVSSRRSVDSVGSRRSNGRTSATRTASPYRLQAVGFATRSPVPQAPVLLSIHQCAASLAALRSSQPHSPPPYADDAFQLIHRGTYLIKYGRSGKPHERFFAIRVMQDDNQRPQLYLVWALHAESACISGRLHMTHLKGVARGTAAAGFQPHLRTSDTLIGPFVGSKPSQLPTKFAFSLVFQSTTASRNVDLLALDEQTYRCWLLVCDYLGQVNQTQGSAAYVEPEPMLPDTPRSQSSTPF